MLFQTKPETVEAKHLALSLSNGDYHSIYLWVESFVGSFNPLTLDIPKQGISIDPETGYILLATVNGLGLVKPGDWILRHMNNTFTAMTDEEFRRSYV